MLLLLSINVYTLALSGSKLSHNSEHYIKHASNLDEMLQHCLKQVPHLTLHNILQALQSAIAEESLMTHKIQSKNVLVSSSSQASTEPLLFPFSITAQSRVTLPSNMCTSL